MRKVLSYIMILALLMGILAFSSADEYADFIFTGEYAYTVQPDETGGQAENLVIPEMLDP